VLGKVSKFDTGYRGLGNLEKFFFGPHVSLLTIRISHLAPVEVRYLTPEGVDIFDENCGPNTFSAY